MTFNDTYDYFFNNLLPQVDYDLRFKYTFI